MDPARRQRSTSRSRPTTPLRPSSRSSIRDAHGFPAGSFPGGSASRPAISALEPQLAELADSMADLEANFIHLQLMHESLSRFNESFASFLYGLNMNAFCADFPESPMPESFRRFKKKQAEKENEKAKRDALEEAQYATDNEAESFLTTDTTFVDNPQTARSSLKFSAPGAASRKVTSTSNANRGSAVGRHSSRGGPTGRRRARATGLTRPRGRGVP
ncbi:DASH complex subunit dam1 [Myotisia sp. PD_48]|nr:DASH complex subunit dam1 [Myotisia sp. PD_48]